MKYVQPVGGAVNAPYVDANPGSGVEGSPVPAAAIEHPQREIMAVIAAAGLSPSSGDLTQLLQALRSAGVFQTQPTGDQTTKVATTAFCDPSHLLGTSGYQKLSSGLIIQWGTLTTNASGVVTWTFPIAFPTAAIKVVATAAGPNVVVTLGATTAATQLVNSFTGSTGAGVPANVSAIAIGW